MLSGVMVAEPPAKKQSGARHLADALVANGVDRIFCVPGESFLALLDALYDQRDKIDVVSCRQEGGAAMMAEADGKLTGRPGIVMVTRGPGATNGSAGLHVARQDSTPLIMLIGQVGHDFAEREAFQEIDYRKMFGEVAKWVAEIDDASRAPEFMARAFSVATSGRPGPVVLALPEDMLAEEAEAVSARPMPPLEIFPSREQMQALRGLLAASQRPLVIVGGSLWDDEACASLQSFAEANDLPVAAVFRRQDRFDNAHRCYAGDIGIGINPKLKARVEESDLLIVLGARLGEMTTGGYTLIGIPDPRQKMIHVHAGAEELGRVYRPDLAINATPRGFCSMLGELTPVGSVHRATWRSSARADCDAWQAAPRVPGKLQIGEIAAWLRENLPADAIVTNGAGNFSTWANRFYRYRGLGTQLAPTSGSMGYGLPAAVAAKLRHPERTVVCFSGDGDFLMTGQEFATAVQYGANIVVLVIDNSMYGTIRMHQERHFPGRTLATHLKNPDFVALANAYGAYGERVETSEEFPAAFQRAAKAGSPALLHLPLDPEAITPRETLSGIRKKALGQS